MKTIASLLTLAALVLTSCSGSDSPTEIVESDPPAFKELTTRENVLFNLEQAYEQKNQIRYDEMLDADFTFFFSGDDVQNNGLPTQWSRATEVASATNLFDPTYIPRDGRGNPRSDAGPVDNIWLHFQHEEGEDKWYATPAPDQDTYPNEMWYEKTIEYSLTISAGHLTLTNSFPRVAKFTVRSVNIAGETQYRIVHWRDDFVVGTGIGASSAATATEEYTWGGMKSMFD